MKDYILQMQSITKEFPGVRALDNVCLDVERGEIHAIVGENGAGKSTLMKVLSGEHTDYEGRLIWDGGEVHLHGIKDSESKGIAIIHQELGLVNSMTVCDNIFLGNEIMSGRIINRDVQYKRCGELCAAVGLHVNPFTTVGNLGVGQQQLVEIAKALSKEVKILILDEPTAALPEEDSENLLRLMKKLKSDGMTLIFISHKLNEVFSIADTITVLRDGKTIVSDEAGKFDTSSLISAMVGRTVENRFAPRDGEIGEIAMEIEDWSAYDGINKKWILKDVSMNVRSGEIVGIAGMIGAGRTELALSIFGALEHRVTGKLKLNGKERPLIRQPKEAIDAGVYYLSEDRKRYGLILTSDVTYNCTLASLNALIEGGIISKGKEHASVQNMVDKLRIKTPSLQQRVQNLSGGNQQKVCIAKALLTEPSVLLLDEATRGIDVGAKTEIYQLITELAQQGIAVVLISSELPEVLGLSDRIYVMREGKITAEFDNTARDITQEQIALAATGGTTV